MRPYYDDILATSKGIILWDDQIDKLFSLFFPDYAKDIELRKAVSQKRPEIFVLAERLKFDYDITLNDVIRERMLFSVTCKPHHSGSKILFRHLRKLKEKDSGR